MPSLQLRLLSLFPSSVLALSAWGQVSAVNSPDGKPLSQRVVAYWIDARLNTECKDPGRDRDPRISQSLRPACFHHSLSPLPQRFPSPIHLFQGVASGRHRISPTRKEEQGSIDIKSISAEGYGDLSQSMRFTAPDDGNQDDHTVMEVTLPKPLAPGEAIRFQIAFHDKFPLSVARNGYKRDFIMGASGFPRSASFGTAHGTAISTTPTQNSFPILAPTTSTSRFPQRYIVGASGIQTGGASQLRWHQDAQLSRRRYSRLRLGRLTPLSGRRRYLRQQPRPGEAARAGPRLPC